MSEIYNIDFETGDFTEWDNDSSGAELFVSSTGAIGGTYSCNHTWKTGTPRDVSNDTGFALGVGVTIVRTACKIKLVSLDFGTLQTEVTLHTWVNGSTLAKTILRISGSDVVPVLGSDVGSSPDIIGGDIDDGAVHTLEYRIVKESAPAAGDGIHELFVDGISVGSNTSVNNFALFVAARAGILNWVTASLIIASGSGHSGGIITDDWILRDDDTQIYPPPAPGDTGSYIIGTAIDNETDGTTAWLTAWRDGTLYLQRWGLPGLSKDLEITLGAATLAQVQAKSKIAYPYAGSDQTMWVFGNMDSPAFVTGTVHLIETTGAGASGTWTISPDLSSWASTDVLDSLIVTPDLDGIGTREFIAVRRRTGTAPELWQGLNALTLASALPLPTGTGVEYRGMHMGRNESIALGTDTLGIGVNRIISAPSPYTTWTDITNDYPSGTVQVLRYL